MPAGLVKLGDDSEQRDSRFGGGRSGSGPALRYNRTTREAHMLRALRGLLLFVVLALIVLAGLYAWVQTSLPRRQGAILLGGLSAAVEVARDVDGVPHIDAASQEDVYFALGFVHAQDRLWQMEERRLLAAGRLAELLGERALASDRFMRSLGLYGAAERDLQALTPRARGIVQAYSEGINAFLDRRSGAPPPEFLLLGHRPEPWAPVDVLARAKLFAWEQAGDWREDLLHGLIAAEAGATASRSLWPTAATDEADHRAAPPDLLRRLPLMSLLDATAGFAGGGDSSLAWAVSGEHTAGGAALLAIERHGEQQAPSPWYLVQLTAPGLDVSGATLPGIPAVLVGRNDAIAWALTGADHDTQDLYIERLEADRYLTPDGWQELETVSESLEVRGGDDVQMLVRRTRHGPLVSDALGPESIDGGRIDESTASGESLGLSLSWTALLEVDRSLQGAIDISFARNWDQLGDALRNLQESGQSVLYADVEGSIGVQTTGRVPVRAAGVGRLPVPGWDESFDWDGFVPYAELPRIRDPASGVIVAAGGEPPQTSRAPSRQRPPASRQILELLNDLEFHTAFSFERMLGERPLPLTADLLPLARAARPTTDAASRAHAELLAWDGSSSGGTAAPILFSTWYSTLARLIFADDLGETLAAAVAERPALIARVVSGQPQWCDDGRTAEAEDCRDLSTRALRDAVARLGERHGDEPDSWRRRTGYEEIHAHPVLTGTTLAGLFDVRIVVEEDGSAGRAVAAPVAGARGVPARGPVLRAVFDLGDDSSSGYLLATGQSGNPLARDYRAFTEDWGRVDLVPLRRYGAAETGSGRVLVLEPRR
ncbi:MAG: penicillin acylase family protein [Trueperaceae bacterium]